MGNAVNTSLRREILVNTKGKHMKKSKLMMKYLCREILLDTIGLNIKAKSNTVVNKMGLGCARHDKRISRWSSG